MVIQTKKRCLEVDHLDISKSHSPICFEEHGSGFGYSSENQDQKQDRNDPIESLRIT